MSEKNRTKLIKSIIKQSKTANHRSIFVILGSVGVKQVPVFYNIVSKSIQDYCVLWCAKDVDEKFIADNKKLLSDTECDSFPRHEYCSYKCMSEIAFQSYKIVVLQDYEELTPSVLSFVNEIVKGGGILIFLIPQLQSLDEFASVDKVGAKPGCNRFQQRFLKSLLSCRKCCIIDEDLNVLSPKTSIANIGAVQNGESKNCSEELQLQHQNDMILGPLIKLCQTTEQANLLIKLLDFLKKRTLHSVISVSSPKGRGKSAAFGLAVAGSLALNYSNIYLSCLNYNKVKNVFQFLFKGLDALNYQEDTDYDVIESVNPEFQKALIGVNVFKHHPQAVRFIYPNDVEQKLEQAELVIIEDAAAIPFQLLKRLAGSHVLLMSSTVDSCGGSGKFLHESIIKDFQSSKLLGSSNKLSKELNFTSVEQRFESISLSEHLNYAADDVVEVFLNDLLCFQTAIVPHLTHGCPEPQECRLLYVCRETLFSRNSYAETFLQQFMSLLYSSKRTISANYILEIANDPDYHIFCLLPPHSNSMKSSPEILCAILVHVENVIPQNIIYCGSNNTTLNFQCFQDWKISNKDNGLTMESTQGIHILDIVSHPHYRRMGYGIRALQLLQEFYEGKCISLDEDFGCLSPETAECSKVESNVSSPEKLLYQLSERKTEQMHYLFASFNLTLELLKFWKKSGFVPVYISPEKNSSCEHICLMMKSLTKEFDQKVQEYWRCFKEYYFILLCSTCRDLPSSFALNLLHSSVNKQLFSKDLTKAEIDIYLNPHRMKSLEKYCQNLGDIHCIIPCIPVLTKLYFRNHFKDIHLPIVQEVILLSLGAQRKSVDETAKDLGLPASQVHGLLNRTIRKLTKYLSDIIEKTIEKSLVTPDVKMKPVAEDLNEELEKEAEKVKQQQTENVEKLKDLDFSQYAIKGSEEDWEKALHSGRKTLVSIKSIKKKPEEVEFPKPSHNVSFKSKNKDKKFKKKR
ncbi:RNA cytidine acetyltransferase-like [Uloborus diversus]|uniref:RNA cytidine acetyltransferase-like n=1 Tax=Uloborus diversus TaxID=327109 RepID=UPI00240994BE|nr:RNA cytidine acetyltransferase-like [Uloborus diversus]